MWLAFAVFLLVALYFLGLSIISSLIISFGIYILFGGYEFFRILILTLPRDLRGLVNLLYLDIGQKWMEYRGHMIIDLFNWTVRTFPNKVAFLYDDQSWTFQHLDEFSNRVANGLLQQGFKKGDVICIFMESRPAYVGIWLGMAKIGVLPALINFNLRQSSLTHCIKDAKSKAIIYGFELSSAVEEVIQELDEWHSSNVHQTNGKVTGSNVGTRFILYSADYGSPEKSSSSLPGSREIDEVISSNCSPPQYYSDPSSRGKTTIRDALLFIYTSGTTGLPKAAIINQSRFHFMSMAVTKFFNISSEDIIYNSLPLYHTAGGMIGVGQALLAGATVVIRRKFSATRFWEECVQYNCTVIQYIGEICRYLLVQPVRPFEKQHRVRLAFGNGIRPQIWEEFQKRFNVAQIGEFYGATESNANIINPSNKVGAVGFTTRIASAFHNVSLIRIDESTGEPLRDTRGLCIRCNPGEVGEMIGRIGSNASRKFDGYVNKKETSKKVVENVFRQGDRAFRSGDLLVMDDLGWFYFRDRLGDTFRWRGENVSTTEVEALISKNLGGQHDCVVYGVQVPNCEGRAGMVCIEDQELSVDVEKLAKDIIKTLPAYSRPIFLRLTGSIESTGTFKLKKVDLAKQGFDPHLCGTDRLFYMDAAKGSYSPLTTQEYADIVDGKIRL